MIAGLEIRETRGEDAPHMKEWLSDPETTRLFPVGDPPEISEAAQRWVDFYKQGFCLTAVYQGTPVGIGILFVQHYVRLRHQCMHILLVQREFRRMGIGRELLHALEKLAMEKFGIELIHVEVYGDEGMVDFYKREGYAEFARQEKWLKDHDEYLNRVLLERFLPRTEEL